MSQKTQKWSVELRGPADSYYWLFSDGSSQLATPITLDIVIWPIVNIKVLQFSKGKESNMFFCCCYYLHKALSCWSWLEVTRCWNKKKWRSVNLFKGARVLMKNYRKAKSLLFISTIFIFPSILNYTWSSSNERNNQIRKCYLGCHNLKLKRVIKKFLLKNCEVKIWRKPTWPGVMKEWSHLSEHCPLERAGSNKSFQAFLALVK